MVLKSNFLCQILNTLLNKFLSKDIGQHNGCAIRSIPQKIKKYFSYHLLLKAKTILFKPYFYKEFFLQSSSNWSCMCPSELMREQQQTGFVFITWLNEERFQGSPCSEHCDASGAQQWLRCGLCHPAITGDRAEHKLAHCAPTSVWLNMLHRHLGSTSDCLTCFSGDI